MCLALVHVGVVVPENHEARFDGAECLDRRQAAVPEWLRLFAGFWLVVGLRLLPVLADLFELVFARRIWTAESDRSIQPRAQV